MVEILSGYQCCAPLFGSLSGCWRATLLTMSHKAMVKILNKQVA